MVVTEGGAFLRAQGRVPATGARVLMKGRGSHGRCPGGGAGSTGLEFADAHGVLSPQPMSSSQPDLTEGTSDHWLVFRNLQLGQEQDAGRGRKGQCPADNGLRECRPR